MRRTLCLMLKTTAAGAGWMIGWSIPAATR